MSTRSNFLKSELQKIYNSLNMSYEYADFSRLENDTKFIKVEKVKQLKNTPADSE